MDETLRKAREDVLLENTAQAVFNHLDRLKDNRSRFGARWIWELLQNARDAAPPQGVSIELSVTDTTLSFTHNGHAFKSHEVAHLIYHGSTKVESEDKVGHLGSGFLSTHLLSPFVRVSGQIDDGRSFSFVLDRSGHTVDDLLEAMDRSWDGFERSLKHATPSAADLRTEFLYDLRTEAADLISVGLGHLREFGGLVLAFSHEITSVSVTGIDKWSMLRGRRERASESIDLLEIDYLDDKGTTSRVVAVAGSGSEVQTAIPFLRKPNGLKVDLDPDTPRLFIEFPLIGTHRLPLPVVVNSRGFKPREDRDGIVLDGDSEGIIENKRLLEHAAENALVLLEHAAQSQCEGVEYLLSFDTSQVPDWADATWLSSYLRTLMERECAIALMQTTSGDWIPPRDASIPYAAKVEHLDKLWELASVWRGAVARLPRKEKTREWARNLVQWASLTKTKPEESPEAITILKLAKLIDSAKAIAPLGDLLPTALPVEWLRDFIELVVASEQTKLLDELSLLPSQAGQLKRRPDLLYDSGISQELKEIAQLFNVGLFDKLLDPNVLFESLKELLKSKREEEALLEVLAGLKHGLVSGRMPLALLKGNASLLGWIAERDTYRAHIHGYPLATEDEHDGLLSFIELAPNAERRPLVPVSLWPVGEQPFVGLFPKKWILHKNLAQPTASGDSVWLGLQQQGYVHIGPLYRTQRRLQDFLPQQVEFVEAAAHKTVEPIDVSDIAFLSEEDIGIIDSVRKSRTRAVEFLRFLTMVVAESDEQAFESVPTPCECGATHDLHRGAWLVPLRKRRWLPSARESRKAVAVSAEALSELLADESELIRALAGPAGSRLLQALGVSPAEFQLRGLAEDEETRVALVRSLGDLRQAAGGSVDRLTAIVKEIGDHPELLDSIEQHRIRREKVLRNQRLGRLVEDLLRDSLKARGLLVKRTGVGSDFEVENDFTVDGNEVLFEIESSSRSVLIEVKSARADFVRMTPAQAGKASEESSRFVLCVVPLSDTSPTPELVRTQSRFVFTIGERVRPVWEKFVRLRDVTGDALQRDDSIAIEMAESQVRFRIQEDVWTEGLTFTEAVDEILRRSTSTL